MRGGWSDFPSALIDVGAPTSKPILRAVTPVRIVLADDHALVRAGFQKALAELPPALDPPKQLPHGFFRK